MATQSKYFELRRRGITAFISDRWLGNDIPPRLTQGYWDSVHKFLTDRAAALEHGLQLVGSVSPSERYRGANIVQAFCNPIADSEAVVKKNITDVLKSAALAEKSPAVLVGLLHALGATWEVSNRPVFLKLANHPSSWVRTAVAKNICSSLDAIPKTDIQKIIAMTRDTDPDVRDWATFTLGTQLFVEEVDSEDIRLALVARLRDRHFDTRAEAIVGLARRHDMRALSALTKRLDKAAQHNGPISPIEIEAAGLFGLTELHIYLAEISKWWGDYNRISWALKRCSPEVGLAKSVPDTYDEYQWAQRRTGLPAAR